MQSKTIKKIAVISVVYKLSKERINRFIDEVVAQGIPKSAIYIIDNTKNNIGYGAGINSVLKMIIKKYDYFFVVNPDVYLEKNTLQILLDTFKNNKQIGIIGPKILNTNGNIWSVGGIVDKKRYSGGLLTKAGSEVEDVDFVSGTAMLLKRDVFERIGFFQDDYFLYYEDVDFCFRAKEAGFRCVINPKAVITHYESTSVGKNSPMMQYYMARNHLLFLIRFSPLSIKIRELIRIPKTLYKARNNRYELLGIRDFFLQRFGRNKTIKAKIDL